MIYSHKREQTINLIRESFIENYREKDINKISVKAICEKAGINRSTFYTYYTDVYELRDDVENEVFESVKIAFKDVIGQIENFGDIDEITRDLIVKVLHAHGGVPIVLLARNMDGFIDKMMAILKSGFLFDSSLLSDEAYVHIEIALRYHFAGVVAVMKEVDLSAEEYVDAYFEKVLSLANEGPINVFKKYIFA